MAVVGFALIVAAHPRCARWIGIVLASLTAAGDPGRARPAGVAVPHRPTGSSTAIPSMRAKARTIGWILLIWPPVVALLIIGLSLPHVATGEMPGYDALVTAWFAGQSALTLVMFGLIAVMALAEAAAHPAAGDVGDGHGGDVRARAVSGRRPDVRIRHPDLRVDHLVDTRGSASATSTPCWRPVVRSRSRLAAIRGSWHVRGCRRGADRVLRDRRVTSAGCGVPAAPDAIAACARSRRAGAGTEPQRFAHFRPGTSAAAGRRSPDRSGSPAGWTYLPGYLAVLVLAIGLIGSVLTLYYGYRLVLQSTDLAGSVTWNSGPSSGWGR